VGQGHVTLIAANEPASELRPIGAVARELGLTPRAIRYYEELGLLRPAIRVKGADRLFDASDVQHLQEIKRLREVIGFSLAEIAEILDTDTVRGQLRSRFYQTTDPDVRAQVLREAIILRERRLRIVERKLEQVAAFRAEEQAQLDQLHALLAEEQSRGQVSSVSSGLTGQ
jgi:MerR family transcriptional regulator, repressor of the yfmOP operon